VVVADIRRAAGGDAAAESGAAVSVPGRAFDEVFRPGVHRACAAPAAAGAAGGGRRRAAAAGGAAAGERADFEVLAAWFGLQCGCVVDWKADPACPIAAAGRDSPSRWLKTVVRHQEDYGDGRGGHAQECAVVRALKELLESAGFRGVERVDARTYYAAGKRS